jgi:hypothetical protein
MIRFDHLDTIEKLALRAARGEELPKDYKAVLVPHNNPKIGSDIIYIRIAIVRDGVEIGDVGLACREEGWVIAGSGYRVL